MQLSSQTVYTSLVIFLTQATLTFQSSVPKAPKACPPSNATLRANLTQTIPFYSLATSYPRAITPDQDPLTVSQIRNTLALYPLALDGKNFAALSLVFTPDVVANYSAPLNVLTGLSTLQAALQQSLMNVDTQHSYGTQVIEVQAGGCTAKSVTYLTASHFGRGKYSGQVLYAYGQYQDFLVFNPALREWRIKTRTLVFMGPFVGNLSIFGPS